MSISPGRLWLAFPVHFIGPETCVQYPTVEMRRKAWVRGYTHGPVLARFRRFFLKKLASLEFAAAQGLFVSVHRQTEPTGTPPVHSGALRLLVIGNRQGLFSCSSLLLYLSQFFLAVFWVVQIALNYGRAIYRYLKYIYIFSNEICNDIHISLTLSSTSIWLICVEITAHKKKKPF